MGIVRGLAISLVLCVSLLLTALLTLNPMPVRIQLGLFDVPSVGVGLSIAAGTVGGILVGTLLLLPLVLRRGRRLRRSEEALKLAEQELRDLRALPLQGET